jgi:hypothetical protein
MEWKWSCGEPCERTPRRKQNSEIGKEPEYKMETPEVNMVEGAYQQSLLSENDVWSIDGPQFFGENFGENGFRQAPNKREDTYNKMSEREIIAQIGQNPFLPNHNYLNDIMTQDQFLKPVSTSMEKENSVDS